MAEPTAYDEIQDGRLDSLESLVTAEYQPPEGVEYSYPVSNQGITQDQFRNMMRGLGKGTITQHTSDTAQNSYRLVDHGSDAETNQRNTLILRPATNTGQAETASNGFFHVLTDDMELPFPSVTSSTTYHVTVTYDPRLFKTTPLKIEVYPGPPPTTYGLDHIVLFKVRREPNQLLSQATRTPVNQWLGNVINVWSEGNLPDPTHVEYGTLAVVLYRAGTSGTDPEIYASRGVHGWFKVGAPRQYTPTRFMNDWGNFGGNSTDVKFTLADGIVHLSGIMRTGFWGTTRDIMQLPQAVTPDRTVTVTTMHSSWTPIPMYFKSDGYVSIRSTRGVSDGPSSFIILDGLSYPINN